MMVVLPLAALGLVGAKLVRDQEALARLEVERSFDDRLKSLEQAVQTIVNGFERELGRFSLEVPRTEDAGALRAAIKALPRAVMVMIFDEGGRLLFPPVGGQLTRDENDFLERTRGVWAEGLPALRGEARGAREGGDLGWLTVSHGDAMSHLWWRLDGGRVIAFEVTGIELLQELVTQLPTTPIDDASTVSERIVLADASGQTVYQWGRRDVRADERPKATHALSAPLEGWSLRSYADESRLPDRLSSTLGSALVAGLSGLGLALAAGAWLIWRARTRESQLAQQRVSFVNQVSHELKTPLTNIRMYADLMARDLEDDDTLAGSPLERHLGVITKESERLSRLIKNVLTFARGQENKLTVSASMARPDDIIRAILDLHMPSLRAVGIEVEPTLAADRRVAIDTDLFEQILTNLVSNVEKYGRAGGWLGVTSNVAGETLTVTVADRGPGIAREHVEKVFEPFWRLSDKLSDGVTGTGIGLDIARRIARLHGGDLVLDRGYTGGAKFIVTLEVGPAGVTASSPAGSPPQERTT